MSIDVKSPETVKAPVSAATFGQSFGQSQGLIECRFGNRCVLIGRHFSYFRWPGIKLGVPGISRKKMVAILLVSARVKAII
jgi:hypothetical protein